MKPNKYGNFNSENIKEDDSYKVFTHISTYSWLLSLEKMLNNSGVFCFYFIHFIFMAVDTLKQSSWGSQRFMLHTRYKDLPVFPATVPATWPITECVAKRSLLSFVCVSLLLCPQHLIGCWAPIETTCVSNQIWFDFNQKIDFFNLQSVLSLLTFLDISHEYWDDN